MAQPGRLLGFRSPTQAYPQHQQLGMPPQSFPVSMSSSSHYPMPPHPPQMQPRMELPSVNTSSLLGSALQSMGTPYIDPSAAHQIERLKIEVSQLQRSINQINSSPGFAEFLAEVGKNSANALVLFQQQPDMCTRVNEINSLNNLMRQQTANMIALSTGATVPFPAVLQSGHASAVHINPMFRTSSSSAPGKGPLPAAGASSSGSVSAPGRTTRGQAAAQQAQAELINRTHSDLAANRVRSLPFYTSIENPQHRQTLTALKEYMAGPDSKTPVPRQILKEPVNVGRYERPDIYTAAESFARYQENCNLLSQVFSADLSQEMEAARAEASVELERSKHEALRQELHAADALLHETQARRDKSEQMQDVRTRMHAVTEELLKAAETATSDDEIDRLWHLLSQYETLLAKAQ